MRNKITKKIKTNSSTKIKKMLVNLWSFILELLKKKITTLSSRYILPKYCYPAFI